MTSVFKHGIASRDGNGHGILNAQQPIVLPSDREWTTLPSSESYEA